LNVVLVRFADPTKEVNRVWVVHAPLERLEDVFLCLKDLGFCVRGVGAVKEVDRQGRHDLFHLGSKKHARYSDQL
jgi:hypothetical protein